MGFLGIGKGAAREQAAATLKAAEMQAKSDRENAQAATLSMQSMLAQKKATADAAELLNKPMEQIDVALAPDSGTAVIDENTGRRRTPRSRFFAPPAGSNSIRI